MVPDMQVWTLSCDEATQDSGGQAPEPGTLMSSPRDILGAICTPLERHLMNPIAIHHGERHQVLRNAIYVLLGQGTIIAHQWFETVDSK